MNRELIRILFVVLMFVYFSPFDAYAQRAAIDTTFFSAAVPPGYKVDWDRRGQILFAPEVQDPGSYRLILVFYCSTSPGAPEPEACENTEQEWIAWWEAGGNSRRPLPNKFQKRAGREYGSTEYLIDGVGEPRDPGPPPYFSIRGETRFAGRVMVYAVSRVSAADASKIAISILASIQWRP